MSYEQWEEKRRYKRYSSDLTARFRKLDDESVAFHD